MNDFSKKLREHFAIVEHVEGQEKPNLVGWDKNISPGLVQIKQNPVLRYTRFTQEVTGKGGVVPVGSYAVLGPDDSFIVVSPEVFNMNFKVVSQEREIDLAETLGLNETNHLPKTEIKIDPVVPVILPIEYDVYNDNRVTDDHEHDQGSRQCYRDALHAMTS